jgi:hypothetical protein
MTMRYGGPRFNLIKEQTDKISKPEPPEEEDTLWAEKQDFQSGEREMELEKPTRASERIKMRDVTRQMEAVGLREKAGQEQKQLVMARANAKAEKRVALETRVLSSKVTNMTKAMEGVGMEEREGLGQAGVEPEVEMEIEMDIEI